MYLGFNWYNHPLLSNIYWVYCRLSLSSFLHHFYIHCSSPPPHHTCLTTYRALGYCGLFPKPELQKQVTQMLSFMPGCELQHRTEPVPRSTKVILLHTQYSLLLHNHSFTNKDQNSSSSLLEHWDYRSTRFLTSSSYLGKMPFQVTERLKRTGPSGPTRPSLCCSRATQIRCPGCVQAASEDLQRRPHTQPLGTCASAPAHTQHRVLLGFRGNLLCASSWPLPFVTPLGVSGKSLVLSYVHPLGRYLYTLMSSSCTYSS